MRSFVRLSVMETTFPFNNFSFLKISCLKLYLTNLTIIGLSFFVYFYFSRQHSHYWQHSFSNKNNFQKKPLPLLTPSSTHMCAYQGVQISFFRKIFYTYQMNDLIRQLSKETKNQQHLSKFRSICIR